MSHDEIPPRLAEAPSNEGRAEETTPRYSHQCRLTRYSVDMRSVYVPKDLQKWFPQDRETVPIDVFFDEQVEPVRMNYQGAPSMISGLTDWFRQHGASEGDAVQVEVVDPEKAFRFRFIKKTPEGAPVVKTRTTIPVYAVGEPINYKGMVYGPLNEAGVVILFGKMTADLNMIFEASLTRYPDAVVRVPTPRGYEPRFVEFEYKSSNFLAHGHDPEKVDIIICWEHGWTDCPSHIEVTALRDRLRAFRANTEEGEGVADTD